jgi:hypothetical protein
VEDFYRRFITWAIEDDEVGVIVKSKKPMVLNSLPEINDLYNVAQSTGRCAIYTNQPGVLSSDLSSEIDIAVTIGLTLPATFVDMALCGCRVIHYDATNIRPYEKELYGWGYEKVIFDDVDRLLVACKRYKENALLEPGLGDFSQHIHELDPFRDGKAGERVGSYFGWLLDSFKAGKNRDAASKHANQLYGRIWGSDKVIVNKKGIDTVENRI